MLTRRSSGPSAPRSASILALPPEIRQIIFNQLPGGPSRDLIAVHNACSELRRDVANDASLQPRHQVAQQMAHLAVLVRKAVGQATQPVRAVQCVPLLPLLTPKQRGKLVDVVLNERNYDATASWNPYNPIDFADVLARHVANMAPGLAHLDEVQQTRLVQAVIDTSDGRQAAEVICRFGTELAPLSEALHAKLVDKAIGLAEQGDRAEAIAGLGPGLAHLNANQQEKLLKAAIAMGGAYDGKAIVGLCKGLKYLDVGEQESLFHQAITLNIELGRPVAPAIENLGSSLECLSADQRHTLVTATLGLFNDIAHHDQVPTALRGLAAGLGLLTAQQRNTLVDKSLTQLNHEFRPRAIAALAAGLAHMTPNQQDKLLNAADDLGDGHFAKKTEAIAKFAAGLPSMNEARKGRVVRMAIGLRYGEGRAKAIAALGARLGDLEHEQHQDLVREAINLFKSPGVSTEMQRALGAGLGVALGCLHPDLRHKLVHTVSRELSPDEMPLREATAAAIAGLGAGRPHLDEAQYKALVAAATRLQSRSGWSASFRAPDHRVIMAFAAEAAKVLDPGARRPPAPALRG